MTDLVETLLSEMIKVAFVTAEVFDSVVDEESTNGLADVTSWLIDSADFDKVAASLGWPIRAKNLHSELDPKVVDEVYENIQTFATKGPELLLRVKDGIAHPEDPHDAVVLLYPTF